MPTPNNLSILSVEFSGMDERTMLMVVIYLLQQIAGNKMTANQLSDAAACFCYDTGAAIKVALYLLNQIAVNGTGGGGGGNAQLVTYATGGSPANPTTTSQPALAYDPSGVDPLFVWDVATQSWN